MFTTEIIGNFDPKRKQVDSCSTFEEALSRYAGTAWDDPPHRLLGRIVIIRDTGTGDVWAVGSYRFDPSSHGYLPILTFLRRREYSAVIITFRHLAEGNTSRRDHEVADKLLLPE